MEMPKGLERLNKLMNGEKVKCPKCKKGYISAVGDPKTTSLFRCSECGTSMVPTKAHTVA